MYYSYWLNKIVDMTLRYFADIYFVREVGQLEAQLPNPDNKNLIPS